MEADYKTDPIGQEVKASHLFCRNHYDANADTFQHRNHQEPPIQATPWQAGLLRK
jgi:hypothetical protein